MNPERFDDLTRLWFAAPSRRVFLLQVGALMVSGAFGRVGIRVPRWLGPQEDRQCFPGHPHREGMPCGSRPGCGLCKNGKCIAASDSVCQAKDRCKRCDPQTIACTTCPKGQKCCSDGCCDGDCSAGGACCPAARQCGQNKELCCRECEECVGGICQRKRTESECPKQTHWLVDGCCVCLTTLCGGVCCDAPCLDGKCCEYCGMDNAVCCEGRKCCRERCTDPAEAAKCCECWEDMSAEETQRFLDEARKWAKYVKDNRIPYGQDTTADPNNTQPSHIDCSLFVQLSVGKAVFQREFDKKFRISTLVLDGDCRLRRLGPDEAVRAGDIVAQPRPSGVVGSMHTGIATGVSPSTGSYRAIAMGGTADAGNASELTWGRDSPKGLPGGDQLRVYRPQKPKKDCPKN